MVTVGKDPEIPAGLSDADYLSALDDIGEDRGYFEPIGPKHSAVFTDRGPVLLVTFETLASIRARKGELPLGFKLVHGKDWSQLCIIADGPTWYRDRYVYGYFDRLVDDGFFEDFDRVVFYGAGMAGYAAAAFSVAAPGATVMAVAPQATLSPDIAGWDRRFRRARKLCFTDRYGYAPHMIEGASQVWVFYDPAQRFDAIHTGHFVGEHVTRCRLTYSGPNPEAMLIRTKLLPRLVAAAMEGRLEPALFRRLWRIRRKDGDWLTAMAVDLRKSGRVWRLAKMARSVAERTGSKGFSTAAERNIKMLAEEGRQLPERRAKVLSAAR